MNDREYIENEIACLQRLLTSKCYHYRMMKAQVDELDREIMDLNRQKWALERSLTKIEVLPTYTGTRKRRHRPEPEHCAITEMPVDSMIALLDKMTPEQRAALQSLVDKRLEDTDINETDDND